MDEQMPLCPAGHIVVSRELVGFLEEVWNTLAAFDEDTGLSTYEVRYQARKLGALLDAIYVQHPNLKASTEEATDDDDDSDD